jgi:ferredoxin-NADP reductase
MGLPRASWRPYRVARRVRESATVVSLHLEAADGQLLLPFQPGQFLTFRLPGPDGRPGPRNYSISSDPADLSHYRISVKREQAPASRPDLPPGFGSGFMHDQAVVGAIIDGSAPKGQFALDQASSRPVLLLAGGIGITPLLSMAHALARASRPTWLLHACDNREVQPFADEVAALAATSGSFTAATCLKEPGEGDGARADRRFSGLVTADVLRALLPIGDYDVYLCGPTGFMQAMYALLQDLGVRKVQIRYEFFGPAIDLKALPTAVARPVVRPPMSGPDMADHGVTVTFARSGRRYPWDGAARTLLDFAEAHGLAPAFSCRNGICNTCLCEAEGEVSYIDDPLEQPQPGMALICCSVPATSLVLNL